jgi:hypothetical protein
MKLKTIIRGHHPDRPTRPTRHSTRRVIAAAAVAVAGCSLSSAAYAATSSPAARTVTSNPVCTPASLHAWVAIRHRTSSAGIAYYPLDFTNTSKSACSMSGYPAVFALSKTGGQLGSPAGHGRLLVIPLVNLAPGATAHTVLAYHGGMVSSGGRCGSVDTTAKLRVNLAGLKGAAYPALGLRACSHAGPVYLTITEPIRAGSA